MEAAMNSLGAGEFKARCLAILDEVARTGRAVVVTKRGRPVAQVAPVRGLDVRENRSLRGSVVLQDDLVSPTGATWEAET
jgi:prevent-host-death family protein